MDNKFTPDVQQRGKLKRGSILAFGISLIGRLLELTAVRESVLNRSIIFPARGPNWSTKLITVAPGTLKTSAATLPLPTSRLA